MQPAHVPFGAWGCRTNLYAPPGPAMHNLMASPPSLLARVRDPWLSRPASGNTTPNFNFRDLSMDESGNDYFTHQPIRGSSPTASLAADLSTNFHIDQRCVFNHDGIR